MKTVKLTLNAVEWHTDERPEKDGTYWAADKWFEITEWNFTTEGGWNTHRNDGELYNKCALPDDRIVAWTDKKPYTLEVCDV